MTRARARPRRTRACTLAVEAARTNRADDALADLASGALAGTRSGRAMCASASRSIKHRVVAVARDVNGAAFAELVLQARRGPSFSRRHPSSTAGDARAFLAGCAGVRGPGDAASPRLAGAPPERRRVGLRVERRARLRAVHPFPDVVVSDARPPASLGLARLADWSTAPNDHAVTLRAEEATPRRVLQEIADATEVEINVHGFADAAQSAASLLALSPDADGRYALSAVDIRATRLRAQPIVVLGACHAAKTALYYREAWSLPSAFVAAGARAVLASAGEIPDAEAGPFFEAVLARIRAGAAPALALRDERLAWLAKNPHSWVQDVIEFE